MNRKHDILIKQCISVVREQLSSAQRLCPVLIMKLPVYAAQ